MPGVVVLSWYPPGVADEHGKPSEDLVPAVMDAAHRHSIKVTGERSIKPICLHKHFVFYSDVFFKQLLLGVQQLVPSSR